MPDRVYVSVHDPARRITDGTIFPTEAKAGVVMRKGVCLLSVDSDLIPPEGGALSGWFLKSWGDGWLFDRRAGERGCPMLIHVKPERRYLHWMAAIAAGGEPAGTVKLIADGTGGMHFVTQGLTPVVAPPALDPTLQAAGVIYIRGVSQVSLHQENVVAVCLYAVAQRTRVLWSAVSSCSVM